LVIGINGTTGLRLPGGAAGCWQKRLLRHFQPASHFRHFSPEVPDSLHIGSYPCIFLFLQPSLDAQKNAAHAYVLATFCSSTHLHRTQEVGGSNPPSSIGRTPCMSAGPLFQDRSNRPLKSAPQLARVAEIAWMRGD
jgi:hypothetical protein